MNHRILIVEDDAAAADFVTRGLADAGFAVESCEDGRAGLARAETGNFDLWIFDRMLPGMDGLSLLGLLREQGRRTPAIMLSALGTVDDKVGGLAAGADDYLAKPFSFAELRARVAALLRRADRAEAETQATRIVVGDLEIDLLSRTVARSGRAVSLVAREFHLLEYLARHAGEVVTRTMMLEHVWNCRFDPGSNVVDVHIGRLRRKLEEGERPILHTVRGAGYRLAVEG
ncbi:two-component system OmpR family response regulator [Sphingomonas kyeonggiensis]|uniref:response regulator transcription factor n=1 Tax=Sphingomonas kyeonggiensis TaxID=1268553 RepID=UPI00277F2E88|nr:response regulator transcription factor [Sphingomonas kyeonggiensis]MDQ0249974.1 two-component system OmpR family response regulator [Sphingomonas kyeonggiensis]